MSSLKQFVRPLITVLLIVVTILGLLNVYGDADEVVALAQKTACRGAPCQTRTTRIERTPFAHEYDMAASIPAGNRANTVSTTIRCSRAYVLVGAWSCAEKSK